MEFKGTKGKWKVKHSESKTAWNVVCTQLGRRFKIARCPYLKDISEERSKNDKNEQLANAQLISKAPEMLEMLIDLRNCKETWSDLFQSDKDRIEKLIKEATEL